MRKPLLMAIALLATLAAACSHAPQPQVRDVPASVLPGADRHGQLLRHALFPSQHVPARNVDVWLPADYATHPARRYPVLYLHDGQNLFATGGAYGGVDWGIDEAMARLAAAGDARQAIIVAIWNTPDRLAEYMPRKPLGDAQVHFLDGYPTMPPEQVVSDAYLSFIVDELKPFIDRHYRSLPGRDDTSIMGSSMGGLISLYAVAEYPEVFGAAAAVSTHWPAGDGIVVDWLSRHLPAPGAHRFYFDYGTETLDAAYAPYQKRMDAGMRALGYREGGDWITLEFPGAEHSEKSWRQRVDRPLRFLLER